MTAPQRLSGFSGIAPDLADHRQQRREQRIGHRLTNPGRQVGHLARVGDKPPVVLRGELFGTKRRQPKFGDRRGARFSVEIGEVTRRKSPTRCLENQFLFHTGAQASNVRTIQVATDDGSTPSIRSIRPP